MSIQTTLSITQQSRKAAIKILNSLNVEQVNTTPAGFNNNIVWNIGHMISVQQRITYGLSGLPFTTTETILKEFKPGSAPEKIYDQVFVDDLKMHLMYTLDQLQVHYAEGKFDVFTPFMTALKVELSNIDDAIAFNQYHEALHMGYVLNLMRFVK
jgi:hypothetical protein